MPVFKFLRVAVEGTILGLYAIGGVYVILGGVILGLEMLIQRCNKAIAALDDLDRRRKGT